MNIFLQRVNCRLLPWLLTFNIIVCILRVFFFIGLILRLSILDWVAVDGCVGFTDAVETFVRLIRRSPVTQSIVLRKFVLRHGATDLGSLKFGENVRSVNEGKDVRQGCNVPFKASLLVPES